MTDNNKDLSVIDKMEALSIADMSLGSYEYYHRKICRYYSKNFHTPLVEVYNLPWSFVFKNYIEHVVETNNNKRGIDNLAIEHYYPEKIQQREKETDDWIKKIEEEERAKREKKLANENPPTQKATQENPHIQNIEDQQIHMGEDFFSHLEEEEEEESDGEK